MSKGGSTPEPKVDLVHQVYVSAARVEFGLPELSELLRRAREANQRRDVTGVLLFADGNFLQVIEGVPDAVAQTFAQVVKDPRHGKITTIIREPIYRRAFEDWSMGFVQVNGNNWQQVTQSLDQSGADRFLETVSSPTSLARGRAHKLMDAFLEGRWRQNHVARNRGPFELAVGNP